MTSRLVVPYPADVSYEKQAIPIPGTKRPGQTDPAYFPFLDENTPGALLTADQIFQEGLKIAGPDREFLGHRPIISTNPLKYANHYVWQTYGQVDLRRRHIGSALSYLFKSGQIGGGELETVGIWSPNRPEWQLVDIAVASYSKVGVSLYDTFGPEAVGNHAVVSIIFTTADHVPGLVKLAPKIKSLKMIVSFDAFTPEAGKVLQEWSQSQNIQLLHLSELEALGKANLSEPVPATPEQLVSLCYTSGTTGNPKGALLSHKNIGLAVHSNLHGMGVPPFGTVFSYLPLAHMYERMCELGTMTIGGRIGFFTGDPLRLLEDAQILKPNFFPSVPRVLNRIYQAAMTSGNVPGVKGAIFRKALAVKLERLHTTGNNVHAFWDKVVFRKIHAVLGGQLHLVGSGSAPIQADVIDFLKIALSCDYRYGLTETSATCTRCLPGDKDASGTIGPPQPINELKLIDVPAMMYLSEDKPYPRGELLIRGGNCFSGYYKDEQNTQATLDSEGWLHTGDVASIDECGRLRIIDRVKNIMKLSQGEYVALEKIENTYSSCPVVAQIYVHGDSLQAFLLGVVVPDPVQLATIASGILGKKVAADDLPTLVQACKDDRVNQQILTLLNKEAKRNGLKGFEMIKRIHVTVDPFSVEDGTLTPTFKLRRKDAYNKFKTEIETLYAAGEVSAAKM
ncbi:long-chain-fatty-acid-CoA ligase [Mycena floridula]|nr:long-chain-fatty-acid-CoA ligase [Mycena floridula]